MSRFTELPKAELHLHAEGTLEPELAFELARRNGVDLPFASVEDLRAAYDFTDLQSFLDLYYATTAVLRTRRDFHDLLWAYLERSAAQGLAHVEVFFDPQAHTPRGVAFTDVVDGLHDALTRAEAELGVTGGLILCFLRDRPVEEAARTLEQARDRLDVLLGVGLDSAEVGFPPAPFAAVFARAAELGLHRVAHAGEEAPASSVTEALDHLGVERVDHGVRCLDDPGLVARLVREAVPLTVCPLSNLRLKVVDDLADHPLPAMLAAGLKVSLHSDDPAYFGGYVGDTFDAVAPDDTTAALLARNAVEGSFASAGRKTELLGRIDDWLTARV
ncbi:adenosine deaminase [Kineococcus rhizosphaerae]|uniref:Adenine deaminase n=1 Tax=Kineococcus rhizosphaerae TaxID=559628 RepID=A0A2T0R7Z5_9ACTN|nr:adenosine deaminase [Kineococcus rhizosphaerae]PRY17296.1 adenosine deaminase [Kineococcus rhizosphaerae]